MEKRATIKIAVDTGMTILLLLLMAYELVGREAHEWLGAGMFALFIAHHCLNWRWAGDYCGANIRPCGFCRRFWRGWFF